MKKQLEKNIEDTLLQPYTLKDLIKEIEESPQGLSTGYDKLDKHISIPAEAITVIAGRPSQGKTTFMLNLLINMCKIYPGKSFFFFSYEENRHKIGLKMLNILSQGEHNKRSNLDLKFLEENIRQNTSCEEIEKAKETFKELTTNNRLWLISKSFYIKDLSHRITYFSNENHNIGAVFIDYFQKIKIQEGILNRYVELQKISETLLETAKNCRIPIIVGAQFGRDNNPNRLDNIRESGDIEQDASLVLGLEKGTRSTNSFNEVPLGIKVLKQREGATDKMISLSFDNITLKISSREKS